MLRRANAAFVRLGAMPQSAVADMVQDAVRANARVAPQPGGEGDGNPFLIGELVEGCSGRARSPSVGPSNRHRTRPAATSQRVHAAATGPALH